MPDRLRSWWRALRDRSAFERDMSDEMRFHLQARIEDLVRRGIAPDEARRRARLEFGNPAAWQTQCRTARRLNLVDDFVADVRFALRGFRRHKLLSAVVVLTLTFGIGIGSAVFTIFSSIALQPPVEHDPDSFVQIYATSTTDRTRPRPFGNASVEEYLAFQTGLGTLRTVAASSGFRARLHADAAESGNPFLVTCNFFDVYGPALPARGRLLQQSDCDAAAPVMVLSDTGWRSHFGGDASVVGRVVSIAGVPVTIVGIAHRTDASLRFGSAWLPYTLRGRLKLGEDPRVMQDGHHGHDRWLTVAGRLTPGATRNQAEAELAVVTARIDLAHPGRTGAALVTNGAPAAAPATRVMILSLVMLTMGALSCLVLIACANVATLLLSRAESRQREIAVRLSLGAGRGRVLRMLLTETLTLAAIAGAASLYVTYQAPMILLAWMVGPPPEMSMTPDWRVFAYLAATIGVAGVAAGMAPALESMRLDVLDSLKGHRAALRSLSGSRFRAALVGVQVALGFVLLVGASLFVITHYQTITRQVGFETEHVLMPRVLYRGTGGVPPSPPMLLEVLSRTPGVRSVAFAHTAPVFGAPKTEIAAADGRLQAVAANEVSPGFFTTVDLPIVRGRALGERDGSCERGTCPVVVSESFARQILHGRDPVGQTVRTKAGGAWQIVGVAGDTTTSRTGDVDPPQAYLPWTPDGRPYQALVRFTGRPARYAPAAAAALRSRFLGAIVDVHTLRWPLETWIDEAGKVEALVVALGGAAIALAAMGLFGIVSFAVARRRQELGVRVALGARRRDIYAAVIATVVRPIAVGLACGVGVAVLSGIAFARVFRKLGLVTTATDPLAYAGAAAVLLVVIGLALAIPARRAAAIDPVTALKAT